MYRKKITLKEYFLFSLTALGNLFNTSAMFEQIFQRNHNKMSNKG